MGNINGEEDQDSGSRTEEKGFYAYAHSGRSRNVRYQGEIAGNQSERAYRANSTKSSIFGSGTSDDGGMICQLISDYRDQVAARKAEIKRLEDETQKLEFRIEEFEALKKQLEQQREEIK